MDILSQQSRSRAKPEFQAIILSGFGSQLGPLIEPHGDEPTPKALLPVKNKPLLSYGLSWLEEADVKDALIVCPPSHVRALTDHFQATSPVLNVKIHAYDPDSDGTSSTVSILKKLTPRIQSDFIVLSCDFVPSPELHLSSLLNLWRVDSSEAIMASLFYEASEEAQKRKDKPLPNTIYKESSILGVAYDKGSEVQIPMHLLTKFGRCRVTSQLADSHVYVFKRSVLELLPLVPEFKSIKKDLVPFLCSLQYSRTRRNKFSHILTPPQKVTTAENVQDKGEISVFTALQYSTTQELDFRTMSATIPARARTPTNAQKNAWDDEGSSTEEASEGDIDEDEPTFVPSLRCAFLVHKRSKDGVTCGRANNLSAYRELNQGLLKHSSLEPKGVRDGVDPKAQISPNSAWEVSSRIGEGSIVASSAIGQHCVIGKQVRIVNSVIMNHVELGDGVRIENCILSSYTKVGEKTELKDCESTPGAEIPGEKSYKSTRLDGKSFKTMSSSTDRKSVV